MGSGETLSPTYVSMYRASVTLYKVMYCMQAGSLSSFCRIVLTNLNEFLRTIRLKILLKNREEQQDSESKAVLFGPAHERRNVVRYVLRYYGAVAAEMARSRP